MMNPIDLLQDNKQPAIVFIFMVFILFSINGIETDLENVQTDLTSLKEKVESVQISVAHISGIQEGLQSNKSPITLTDFGRNIAQQVDAESLVNEHAPKLVAKARTMTPYDIQLLCEMYAHKTLLQDIKRNQPETLKRFTDVAYKEGLRVEHVMQVIGLLLRDEVFNLLKKEKPVGVPKPVGEQAETPLPSSTPTSSTASTRSKSP